jgi:hypothetical protein
MDNSHCAGAWYYHSHIASYEEESTMLNEVSLDISLASMNMRHELISAFDDFLIVFSLTYIKSLYLHFVW